ncbi:MAG: methionine sulfoxide reductase [Thermodesulfobacteriota bacterium]|nr:MAG: methionine sulfoxide reductase [Thermodesulfobacteriota bacterium]
MSQIITKINTSNVVPAIDISAPQNIETLTCAMGCFWGPDCRFGAMDGVVRTRVGYAGGTTDNPTYHSIGDHIETIQIDYDPQKISYEQMLEVFWNGHKPTRTVWKRQYASALFFHNDHQEKLATQTRDNLSSDLGEEVKTELIAFSRFYMAEMYHQKYHLQGYEELITEYRTMYPSLGDIVNSTSAARVNGYIGGYGNARQFEEIFSQLGLSDDRQDLLKNIINKNQR